MRQLSLVRMAVAILAAEALCLGQTAPPTPKLSGPPATPAGAAKKREPPAIKSGTEAATEPSGATKLKEIKAREALAKAKKARAAALAAKDAYERALSDADQADQDAAIAEADYRAALAKDAAARAESARAAAERAVAEAKRADDERRAAERAAAEALRKTRAAATPLTAAEQADEAVPLRTSAADKSPAAVGHPSTTEDLSRYLKQSAKADGRTGQTKDKTRASGSSPPTKQVAADREPEPATLVVTVPARAAVLINGKATSATGTVRTFTTPPLSSGRDYAYDITVSVDGSTITRELTVRSGETVKEDFTK